MRAPRPVASAATSAAASNEPSQPSTASSAAAADEGQATFEADAGVVDPPAAPDSPGAVLTLPRPDGPVAAADARRVLHIGDSMVPLVGVYLRQAFRARGGVYIIENVDSTTTSYWASHQRVSTAVYKYAPDLVLISLGSNQLFDPRPERMAGTIRQIVRELQGRPCLWVGPPAWQNDLGFLSVLTQHLGHCRYFDSTRLTLSRMADGRHPDWTGGWHWASAVWKTLGGPGTLDSKKPRR